MNDPLGTVLNGAAHRNRALLYTARTMGLSLHLVPPNAQEELRSNFDNLLTNLYSADQLREGAEILNKMGGGVWGPHRLAQIVLNLVAAAAITEIVLGPPDDDGMAPDMLIPPTPTEADNPLKPVDPVPVPVTVPEFVPDSGVDCHG